MSHVRLLLFNQELKTPPTSYFIKKALDLKGGSQKPGHQAAGQLSLKHVLEIATVRRASHPRNGDGCSSAKAGGRVRLQVKQKDAPELTLEALCKSVIGSARSMGVSIEPHRPGSEAATQSAATDAAPAAA